MAKKPIPVWSFQIPAVLFLIVAIVPALRGGSLNMSFVVLAAVCAVLSVAVAARNRRTESESSTE